MSSQVRILSPAQGFMEIYLTKHAKEKFKILLKHKFKVKKSQVIKTIEEPESIDYLRLPLLINQRKIDKAHYLRVVYKKENDKIKIITFYPSRIKKHEKKFR